MPESRYNLSVPVGVCTSVRAADAGRLGGSRWRLAPAAGFAWLVAVTAAAVAHPTLAQQTQTNLVVFTPRVFELPPSAPMCGLADLQMRALAYLNDLRAAGADCGTAGRFSHVAPLSWSILLTQSAHGHANDMAERDYFSHVSADGRTLADRVSGTGYEWRSVGEDIAAGYTSIESVMNAWLASASHCATLMNPKVREVGLACVSGTPHTLYRTYWSLNVGQPR
ncbi:hypothetical protein BH11PSE8_BH11PSE8_42370 [soil metagenome]